MNTGDPAFWQFWINVVDFFIRGVQLFLLAVVFWIIYKLHRSIFHHNKNL